MAKFVNRIEMHGSNLDVDTSAEQLTSNAQPLYRGILVKADAENTGIVYIGDGTSVTAGDTDATDGFPLSAGESIFLEITLANQIYVIASATNQKLYFLGT